MAAEFISGRSRPFEVPLKEIYFTYARSSGPGGQNVNKVNSKTVLYWNVRLRTILNEEQRARILIQLESRINQEGELVLTSDRYRDQPQNREDCIEKLRELILPLWTPPRKRKKTKPTRSSVRRSEQGKKMQSEKKNMRGRVKF